MKIYPISQKEIQIKIILATPFLNLSNQNQAYNETIHPDNVMLYNYYRAG